MSEWIKCSERMPPQGEMVICYSSYYQQVQNMTLRLSNERWWSDIDGDWQGLHKDVISHWMPLPEPPNE